MWGGGARVGRPETVAGGAGALRSRPAFPPCVPSRPNIPAQVNSKASNPRHNGPARLPKGQSAGRGPACPPVSLPVGSRHSCGQLAIAPKGQEPREVGGTSSCRLGPLGGHRQPRCSSSSQTMRVIFSQCFNASQLAGVQGGSPPPSPPRRQPLAQPTAYAAASASLFSSFQHSSSSLPTTPKLEPCPKEIKKIRGFDQRSKS